VPGGDTDAEQDKWLDEAVANVKKQAWQMKRALDNSDVNEALKYAAAMTSELRTSSLSPKNYYEVYMDVTNELRELENFFEEEDKSESRSIVELYEHVQHAGNILPRLYLLITVASVYIKTKKAPAKDILFDLVELCRGVQHPMRGLFLRNYLSQASKDKLPDTGTEYEGAGGTVKDSIDFILQNFDNMNKLWVRMQHQGAVRDKQRREKERRNLRQLVGTNLVRLSEMEGVDLTTYKEDVLPHVLEQIVNCKDIIAQEYLMDVIIQVFPDDFHLQTLETYLQTLNQLQKGVNVKNIIVAHMNRLANFAKESRESIPTDIDMFPMFLKYSSQCIEGNKMPLEDVLQLQVALIVFASSVYPDRVNYIDHVLNFTAQYLEKSGVTGKIEKGCEKYLLQLLSGPLDSLSLRVLELNYFAPVMSFLSFRTRKQVAVNIIDAVIKSNQILDTAEKVDKLFTFISPVLKDQDDGKEEAEDNFEFDQEQTKAAQLFDCIHNADTDVHFQLYATARKHYGQGGDRRIPYSLPPLVFGCLKLARRIFSREEAEKESGGPVIKAKKVFGFVIEIISVLSEKVSETALRLFLQAATASDALGYEAIAYEYVAQAFLVYEDQISDSKAQLVAIGLIVAHLHHMKSFGTENYDTLTTKASQHSAKLLRKPDQCRAVYECAHLFWTGTDEAPGHRDDRRVLECLQRALKIANGAINFQVFLFVEILNKYLYFFGRQVPSIHVKFLKGLIDLIDEHTKTLTQSEAHQSLLVYYQNTREHIQLKQSLDDATGERFRPIFQEGGDAEADTEPEAH